MARLLFGILSAVLISSSVATASDGLAAQAAVEPADVQLDVQRAVAEWRAAHGPSWRTLVYGDTGRVEFLYGGSAQPARVPDVDEDYGVLALEAVESTRAMHGIDTAELVVDEVQFLPLAQIGSTDKLAVRLVQRVGGVPVSAGTVNCVFDTKGNLLALHAQAVPDARRIDLVPSLGTDAARALAAEAFTSIERELATEIGAARLEITRAAGGRLAWRVEVRSTLDGAVPVGREFWIDAHVGEVLDSLRTVHEFEVRGNVRALITPGLAPDTSSNPETAVAMRYLNVSSSAGTVRTDALGNFVFPDVNSSLAVTVNFTGAYNNVQNVNGSEHSLTQTIPANTNNTLTLNPSSSAQVTAQGNAFHSVNLLRDFVRSINPLDSKADFVMSANVNLNQSCNAFFDGSSTNYYLPGGGCVNTAFSTVIGHENGHWLNVRYGTGNGPDGMGEGNADVWAMYLYDSPVVGLGFCGSSCNIRSGLNTRSFCGDYTPQCYGEVHVDGEPWMGAAWKVRTRLNTSLGNALGDLTADTLFLAWMNAFDQTSIRSIIETQWLVLDDDDGNLNDGSPHYVDIDGGFRQQGFPGVDLNPVTIESVTIVPNSTVEVGPYGIEARVAAHFDGLTLASADLYWRVNGSAFTQIALAPQGGSLFGNSIPIVSTPAQVDYYIVAGDSAGNSATWPAVGAFEGFQVGVPTAFYSTDFESGAAGWTHSTYGDTSNPSDEWQLGSPAGKSGTAIIPGQQFPWRDPASAYSGSNCWGIDLGNGSNGTYATNVHVRLVSPPIDCSGSNGVHLWFRRWLSVQFGAADQARIRVNGVVVWSNPLDTSILDLAWRLEDIDISAWADGVSSVQIEFELQSNDTAQLGGWNIDDFALTRLGPAAIDCVTPTAYGPGKIHSASTVARLEAVGEPSSSFGPFQLRMIGGVPFRPAVVYSSSAPATTSMLGGMLLIAQPFAREVPFQLDQFGDATATYTVQPFQVGTTRYFQGLFRDPFHPDGTGMGFSKALRIGFCP